MKILDTYYLTLAALFGSIFGSFFNMLIYRLPRDMDLVFKRSHCPQCQNSLKARDLIPLFSYLFNLGKCRYCKKIIPIRYLVVELLSIILFVYWYLLLGISLNSFFYLIFFSCLLITFFTDWETQIIPDSLNIIMLVSGLLTNFLNHSLINSLEGLAVGGGTLLLISVIGKIFYKKEVMGGGDIKLMSAIGAFWGLKTTIISLYFSFLIGGFIGILLLVLKIKKRTDFIPFGPMLILGNLAALILGDIFINYLF